MAWRDKVAKIKALSLDNDRRAEILQVYKTVQMLYIDDLFKIGRSADGTATPTAADVGIAFEILNQRYINHLTTIISTEKCLRNLWRSTRLQAPELSKWPEEMCTLSAGTQAEITACGIW